MHKKELVQKLKTRQQIKNPPACHKTTACRAEVKVLTSLPQGAAETALGSCATRMWVMFKNQCPYLPVLNCTCSCQYRAMNLAVDVDTAMSAQ